MSKVAQAEAILKHIKKHKFITSAGAFDNLGVTSFHRRISDLKNRGHKFRSQWAEAPNRFGTTSRFKKYYYAGWEA